MTSIAYVGCRTTRERHARGDGIGVFRVDGDRPWTRLQTCAAGANPSFLAIDAARRILYSVHGDQQAISSYAIDEDGLLTRRGEQDTGGRNPVHLWIAGSRRHVVVANYAGGSIASLPVRDDGTLGPSTSLVALPGPHGPHVVEQAGSHPHQVVPVDDRTFLVPDKGLDRLFVARIDDDGTLSIDEERTIAAKEAAGPRHAVFATRTSRLYVANELDSTVTTYAWNDDASATPLEIVTTLPVSCVTKSHAAGIALTPDGRSLFVSNRGDDSITCFAIGAPDFVPRHAGWTRSGGAKPRFITLDPAGERLLVANEDGDTIVSFAIDRATGTLRDPLVVARTGSPVCIVFDPVSLPPDPASSS